LLTEPNLARAAYKVGVSLRTLKNWLVEPNFQAAYRSARKRLLDRALLRLEHASGRAVATLVGHMRGQDARVSVRAAKIILDQLTRLTETLNLAERVEALEHQAREKENRS
jgi:hypothetical protein